MYKILEIISHLKLVEVEILRYPGIFYFILLNNTKTLRNGQTG